MDVPMLDLDPIHQPIWNELKDAVIRVLESNRFIGGPELDAFEREVASYCGVEHAIGVSSGTDALLASLMALGIGAGDEVIIPTFTFFATAGSVHRVGARIVFCDIDPITFNLDPEQLNGLIRGATKAVIPVHLFGQCAEMSRILEICQQHGLSVIEDAAQSLGARYHGRMAGSMGHAGCFSFFPAKNLGGIGDGGAIISHDRELAEKLRSLRNHGASRKYFHSDVGGNFRLDAVQAAALRVKLPQLERWHEDRRTNARLYREAFSDLEEQGLLRLPVELPGRRHVFNQFVVRLERRDALQDYLNAHHIGTAVYYPLPLHLQDCFEALGYRRGSLPVSEQASREVLALPVYPGLNEVQRNKVIHCVREFFRT
ncbi:MAG: DegT/DnrJ/EryC1/StrS family aminotransferase [Deltaproteobacteria bacterium]